MAIEKYFKKGQYFKFPGTGAFHGRGVVSTGVSLLQINDPTRQKRSESKKWDPRKVTIRGLSRGENPDQADRNFVWLPWVDGAVNYADAQGKDVMSGPFSGCYLIRYKRADSDWRVAHVSTSEDLANDARADWNTLAAENGFVISCGFKPSRGKTLQTYGIITAEGVCYRIEAGSATQTPTEFGRLITRVEKVTTIPPTDLMHLVAGNGGEH